MSQFDWLFEESFSCGKNKENSNLLEQYFGMHIYWSHCSRLPEDFNQGLFPQAEQTKLNGDMMTFNSRCGEVLSFERENKMEYHLGEMTFRCGDTYPQLRIELYVDNRTKKYPSAKMFWNGTMVLQGILFLTRDDFDQEKKKWENLLFKYSRTKQTARTRESGGFLHCGL